MASEGIQIESLLTPVLDHNTGSVCGAGYTAYFYEAGTTTPKNVWTEKEKTNPYTSASMGTDGTLQLYGDGYLKIVIKNADSVTVHSWDDIHILADINQTYDVSAANNVDITGLTAGEIYKFSFRLTCSISAILAVTFNGDGGSNYTENSEYVGYTSGSPVNGLRRDNSNTSIRFGSDVHDYWQGHFEFAAAYGDLTKGGLVFSANGYIDADNQMHLTGGGSYDGATDITRITITPGAGTISGTVILSNIT